MSYSEVWLNGHPSAAGRTATTSWRLDLTPYVSPGGVNQLAIRLDNPPESSRWYPGGGLYRNVRLTKTNRAPLHAVAGHARDGTGRRRRRGDPA
jgi:beta-galactosidase